MQRKTHGFNAVRFLLLFDDSFGSQAEADEFDDIFGALAAGNVAFHRPIFYGSDGDAEILGKLLDGHAGGGEKLTEGHGVTSSISPFQPAAFQREI
jgi:hypothetical protein